MEHGDVTKRILSLAGLCRRAGGVVLGTDAVMREIRSQKSKIKTIVVISSDASERTAKQLFDKSKFYGALAVRINADSWEIARALGKEGPCVTAAIVNKGPYDEVLKLALSVSSSDGAKDGVQNDGDFDDMESLSK